MEPNGEEDVPVVKNPFARSGLARSPPRRGSVPAIPTGDMDEVVEGLRIFSRKRKAEEEATLDGWLEGDLATVVSKVKELDQMVKESPTTKKEIKTAVKELLGRVMGLYRKESRKQAAGADGTQGMVKAQTVSVGVQTPGNVDMEEEARAAEIHKKMTEVNSPEAAKSLVEEAWPKRAFRRTRVVNRSIVAERAVRVIIVRDEDKKDLAIVRSLESQFPALRQVRDKFPTGKVVAITATDSLSVEGEDGSASGGPRVLVLTKVSATPELPELMLAIGKVVQGVSDRLPAEEQDKADVAFHFPEGSDPERNAKIMECCLVHMNWKVDVCAKGAKLDRRQQTEKEASVRKGTVNVTVQGSSYADMLKSVKASASPTAAGVEVQRITQAQDGSLRLRIREVKEGGCRNFTRQISEMTELKTDVRSGAAQQTVVIMDLDETTTAQEVKTGLSEVLQGRAAEAILGIPRKGVRGDWSVTVRLPRASAAVLLGLGRLRVGWVSCRLRELVSPDRCFNCLAFGHLSRDCKKPRETCCFRCGKGGHFRRDCKEEVANCYICKERGHAAESMACPEYKRLVQGMKEKARGRRSGDAQEDGPSKPSNP